MRKKLLLLTLLLPLFFTACSQNETARLKISANSWIGYSPLFYANEMGWLEEIGIKLVHVVSLGESMLLYKAGNVDAFTGTQYEYTQARKNQPLLIPVILFDKSNGGDMVMGNRSIEELRQVSQTIEAYLEVDSVNQLMIKNFLKTEGLANKTVNFINKDQADISTLSSSSETSPTLVVTYAPYNTNLEKQGFIELSNTRDNPDLLVLDALYASSTVIAAHQTQFKQLKQRMDNAIRDLAKDPENYYQRVNPYLGFQNFSEFQAAVNDIIWLNRPPEESLDRIRMSGFPVNDLIH